MASYLAFERPPSDDPVADADRVVFVRDGFSWLAFLFTLPWLLWHRAWLAALVWTLAAIALPLAAASFGGDAGGALSTLVSVALALVAGFEANGWWAASLKRRGYRPAGTVSGRRREDREIRFFTTWLAERGTSPSAAAPPSRRPAGAVPATGPILGLFPEPDAR